MRLWVAGVLRFFRVSLRLTNTLPNVDVLVHFSRPVGNTLQVKSSETLSSVSSVERLVSETADIFMGLGELISVVRDLTTSTSVASRRNLSTYSLQRE